ncbi:MAG: trimethylamine methyltransferase family protein [Acidimicrobiia bacterium]|nr:trimethylamine methyltransferase family protein [Acidimicrobiia bacterium]
MGRRSGGRDARRAARAGAVIEAAPFLTRQIPPRVMISDEGLEIIEHNADRILAEIGIEIHHEATIERFRNAGASVDGTRVRFDPGLVRSLIATAPSTFTQHARNPARSVQIGGSATVFAPAYGSPFVRDLDGGRRYASIADFENFVKLTYLQPQLHHSGGTVCEPVDLPVNKRHFDMVAAHLRLSDKPFMGSVTAGERAQDTVDMAKIVFADRIPDETFVMSLINASSPLTWDATMLDAAEVYAANNQACIFTPFILAGAMSPVTPAAVTAQILAESMVGMAAAQLVRPGAPVVLGAFVSTMDMQSGAPTFGTPEPALIMSAVGELARRLGVPMRTGGQLTASKTADAQAAYESAAVMGPTMAAGTNFVLHAAGWLEGGLTIGYEKFMLDADQLGAYAKAEQGFDLSENAQGMTAFHETDPGQHHLGSAHTLANFEAAFWKSEMADANSFEQWEAEGSKDAEARASEAWRNLLAGYEQPALPPDVDDELTEWIDRRKASFPDSNV